MSNVPISVMSSGPSKNQQEGSNALAADLHRDVREQREQRQLARMPRTVNAFFVFASCRRVRGVKYNLTVGKHCSTVCPDD